MLSRVADSIYWMSRYIERAENVARCVEVNVHLTLDLPTAATAEQWEALVTTSGDRVRFAERFDVASRTNVIQFLAFDIDNPNSILSCLTAARENARMIREVITSEMWEQLNTFYLLVRDAARQPRVLEAPQEFLTQVRMASHLFTGVTDATMSHGEAWRFDRLGRKLERADKTTRILDVKYFLLLPAVSDVGSPVDDVQWAAVLRSASALEMYRKRHGRVAPDGIVDFLLLDREFPRAVHCCLIVADDSLHAISGTPSGTFSNPAEQRLGQLRSELAFTDVRGIIAAGVHEFLDGLQLRLNLVADAIHETFFVRSMAIEQPYGPASGFWGANQ
ncbi:MAG: alpha-E domain-containing protein [Deltaproteobacteria bacterium]|nr:alpha-E domain-containing protein [Deltaproteobacteria bacterium]MBI3387450.1 alpha-E domain-containing protein [Deltaproteobacteria bacterium]